MISRHSVNRIPRVPHGQVLQTKRISNTTSSCSSRICPVLLLSSREAKWDLKVGKEETIMETSKVSLVVGIDKNPEVSTRTACHKAIWVNHSHKVMVVDR